MLGVVRDHASVTRLRDRSSSLRCRLANSRAIANSPHRALVRDERQNA
jgi:hypothetical protein